MKKRHVFLIIMLVSILIITGCGVPDIDEHEQAGLQSLVTLHLSPPDAPTSPKVIAGQQYLTTIASDSIQGNGGTTYNLTLPGGAASELVAILNVETVTTTRNLTLDTTTTNVASLFSDNTYHVNVRRIISRNGPTAQIEFNQAINNLDAVTITFEYSLHYDTDASGGDYDPEFLPYQPIQIRWEAPSPHFSIGDSQGTVIGYRVVRNFVNTADPIGIQGNAYYFLDNFDNKVFAASGSADVDTRYALWTHTNEVQGKDTSLTQLTGAADREFWEDVFTYYVLTVDEFGNTSRWSEAATVRTVPPVAFPEITNVSALLSDSEVSVRWSYPHKQYNETDNLVTFNVYTARDPGFSTADTQNVIDGAAIIAVVEASDDDDDYDNDEETFSTEYTSYWISKDAGDHELILPNFYWVEAVDKWNNVSRRSSMRYNQPGF